MRAFVLVSLSLCACGPSTTNPVPDAGGGDSCHDTGKTPANLLTNPGFECGNPPTEWTGVYGTTTFPAEGRSGHAAKIVADAAGGRLGYALDVVTAATAPGTYCARTWIKGTAPYMRIALISPNMLFTSNEQVPSTWKQVLYARAQLAAGDKLSLMIEMQMSRTDNMNAKPGDVMYVDDVDVWQSASGKCDER